MSAPAANMSVWVGEKVVCIKIAGRPDFPCSANFGKLMDGLRKDDHRHFVLDLTECPLMDSTFLGVLARVGFELGATPNGTPAGVIELFNPNAYIVRLLDSLGVAKLFKTVTGPLPATDGLIAMEAPTDKPDRKEITRTCLEAHLALMNLNPANIPKFKDVARFLAEDLKKLEAEG